MFSLLPLISFTFVRIVPVIGEFQLYILHNNDMHAQFEETNEQILPCSNEQKKNQQCYGGFARTKTAIKMGLDEAESLRIPSLVINGGDSFRGTPYYTLKKWEIITPLLDALHFDVTVSFFAKSLRSCTVIYNEMLLSLISDIRQSRIRRRYRECGQFYKTHADSDSML